MSDIQDWRVEDNDFWEKTGKRVASRNLWISIPCLLVGFATWLMWGMIAVQMVNLNFPYSKPQLFTMVAIAGFTGATLRIPSSFLIRLCGGRNVIWFTTALMMLPALGVGVYMRNPDTPLVLFYALAFMSGFGGGNFASSMSNISFFYPKRIQGTALGLNAGLGNFGVSVMQVLIPLVMTFPLLGSLSGDPRKLVLASGTLIGKIPAGTDTYLQNAGLVWLLWLIPLFFLSYFLMNNLRSDNVSPDIGSLGGAVGKIVYLLIIAFVCAAIGLYFMLGTLNGGKFAVSKYIIVPAVIFCTVMLMRYITPAAMKTNLKRQFKIFNDPEMGKHTWAMTIIYVMTFGSFIGYAASFPLSIKVVFGFKHMMVDGIMTHNIPNPDGPSALQFAWLGPFIGSLIRPIGGWISDKVGGARVTEIVSVVMIISALIVAYFMKAAYASETPQDHFLGFFIMFLVLFAATGVGNGSTFRTIGFAFNEEMAGPVLGWTSAVAAYGAFLIPKIFGEQIKAQTPELALYGFAVFYFVCLVINRWFYLRKGAYIKNP